MKLATFPLASELQKHDLTPESTLHVKKSGKVKNRPKDSAKAAIHQDDAFLQPKERQGRSAYEGSKRGDNIWLRQRPKRDLVQSPVIIRLSSEDVQVGFGLLLLLGPAWLINVNTSYIIASRLTLETLSGFCQPNLSPSSINLNNKPTWRSSSSRETNEEWVQLFIFNAKLRKPSKLDDEQELFRDYGSGFCKS